MSSFAGELRLSLPIECIPGKTCFIQSYVDIDPSPRVKDPACGTATYDGHRGTDFRLLSLAAARKGVKVLAAAPGIVKAVRDNMADRLVKSVDRSILKGRECGNGVVISHHEGWETQYCHMRHGSINVRHGDKVARGQPVGMVGASGLTQFAHLHVSVRHHGRIIDPFTGRSIDDGCAGAPFVRANTLWDNKVLKAFPYRSGLILEAGFAAGALELSDFEYGTNKILPKRNAPAIVFFARLINLRKGDYLHISLKGPKGRIAQNRIPPMEKPKAHYVAFVGKKRKKKFWPKGRYQGRAELIRNGKSLIIQTKTMVLK